MASTVNHDNRTKQERERLEKQREQLLPGARILKTADAPERPIHVATNRLNQELDGKRGWTLHYCTHCWATHRMELTDTKKEWTCRACGTVHTPTTKADDEKRSSAKVRLADE